MSAALGALPPLPLPEGLAGRLARAVQQERLRELAVVRPLRRRRAPAWLPAAAASAALVMAGAVGWSVLDPSAGQDSSDSAASEATGGGGGQEAAPEAGPEAASGLASPAAATDWADEAARSAALARLLAAGESADSTAAAPSGDGLDRLRDPTALQACLDALPQGGDDVLAVDRAQYAGAPAVAVVQPADGGRVVLTVVGSGCSAVDPDVLDRAVLPRP